MLGENYWNYSILDWLYKSIHSVKKEEIIDVLKRVVGTLLNKNNEIGYSREIV